ncbi:MAG: hypothetical protein JOY79_02320, partial [Acidobacteriaceae bacterium]|nr:hypothetical protein [Acidobacteriaceae bacterium]
MKIAGKTHFTSILSWLFAFVVCLAPLRSSAQQSSPWSVDQQHSLARLSLGAGAQSLEAGIARVDGNALFDPADPESARFDLTLHSDEAQTSPSEIIFTSKRSWVRPDGGLSVAGDLSVTRVVHTVLLDPNEGYNGAQYGAPIVYTNSSEVTLIFSPQSSLPTRDGALQLSGSTTVDAEDLPLLRASLQSGDWPNVVVEGR